jgi:signal transduction histidine kinase
MLLEMALAAVIANAIEASPQGSTVRIDLCSRAETMSRFGLNMAAVRVIDYGSGMSEDQLFQGSQPFYTTRPGHEGMGLSVASRFVELHGGFVHLSSVQGEGTQVDIILPLVEPSGRPEGDVALK